MKHENGYWIDENNNRWGECCGKERAKELSSSMINCDNCYIAPIVSVQERIGPHFITGKQKRECPCRLYVVVSVVI